MQLHESNFHRGHSIQMAHPLPNPFGFIVVHFTLCSKGCVHQTHPPSDLNNRRLWPKPLGKGYLIRQNTFVDDVVLCGIRRPPFISRFYIYHDARDSLCAFCLAFSCCNKAQIIESTQACLPASLLAPSPHLPAASRWGVYALTHSDTHTHVWSRSCGHKCKQDADG